MTNYIKINNSAHWYTNQGVPMYDATKKEARENGYYPSVTTITKMLNKPALNTWKQNTLLQCAFTCPNCENETTENYIKRVIEDYQQTTIEAAELGTLFHSQIEDFIRGKNSCIYVDGYNETCQALMNYIAKELDDAQDITCEQTIVGDGYAGRVDLFYKKNDSWHIIDWKTQNIKKLNKNKTLSVTKYPEWLWQLEGYARASKNIDGDIPEIKNIVISTNKKAQGIREITYTQDQKNNAFAIFQTMVRLWRLINDF